MKTYVLIMFINMAFNSAAMTTAEFNSLEACENAIEVAKYMPQSRWPLQAACVPK